MVKNTDFLYCVNTNTYFFRNYDIYFALHVNDKQTPADGMSLGMNHEKSSAMGYRTLFEASDIHHSNSGLQTTHDLHINSYFILLFDLTPDRAASEGDTSHPITVISK